MIAWIANNIGTIAAAAIIVLLIGAALVKVVRDKRKGKSTCGCGCSHCAMNDSCHKSE